MSPTSPGASRVAPLGITGTGMAAAIGLALLGGCTGLAEGDDTCATVEGCVEPLPELTEEWSCLEDGPPEKPAPPDVIALELFVVDFANPTIVPDVSLQACYINDGLCENPLQDPQTGLGIPTEPFPQILQQLNAADESGTLARAVQQILLPFDPNAFYGYIRLTAPDYATLDYVLLDELQLNLEAAFEVPNAAGGVTRIAPVFADPIGLPSVSTLDGFYRGVGEQRDPSKATTVARTFDCDGFRAPDVALETDVSGARWAFVQGVPRAGEQRVTDSQGIIGYANLDPVGLGLAAKVPGRDQVYREASVTGRSDVIVTVDMRPPNARARRFNVNVIQR